MLMQANIIAWWVQNLVIFMYIFLAPAAVKKYCEVARLKFSLEANFDPFSITAFLSKTPSHCRLS